MKKTKTIRSIIHCILIFCVTILLVETSSTFEVELLVRITADKPRFFIVEKSSWAPGRKREQVTASCSQRSIILLNLFLSSGDASSIALSIIISPIPISSLIAFQSKKGCVIVPSKSRITPRSVFSILSSFQAENQSNDQRNRSNTTCNKKQPCYQVTYRSNTIPH